MTGNSQCIDLHLENSPSPKSALRIPSRMKLGIPSFVANSKNLASEFICHFFTISIRKMLVNQITRTGHHFKIKLYHHDPLKFQNFKNQSELIQIFFGRCQSFPNSAYVCDKQITLAGKTSILVYIFVSLEILFTAKSTQESVFIINRII